MGSDEQKKVLEVVHAACPLSNARLLRNVLAVHQASRSMAHTRFPHRLPATTGGKYGEVPFHKHRDLVVIIENFKRADTPPEVGQAADKVRAACQPLHDITASSRDLVRSLQDELIDGLMQDPNIKPHEYSATAEKFFAELVSFGYGLPAHRPIPFILSPMRDNKFPQLKRIFLYRYENAGVDIGAMVRSRPQVEYSDNMKPIETRFEVLACWPNLAHLEGFARERFLLANNPRRFTDLQQSACFFRLFSIEAWPMIAYWTWVVVDGPDDEGGVLGEKVKFFGKVDDDEMAYWVYDF